MKKHIIIIGWLLSVFISGTLFAQNHQYEELVMPYKSIGSVLFGFDINLNDQPDQNQKNISICSAFNGWLYAVHSYFDVNANDNAVAIIRSEDNGETWDIIFQFDWGDPGVTIDQIEIISVGKQDVSNIRIIIGYLTYNASFGYKSLGVVTYDRNGGILGSIFSGDPYDGYIWNFALLSDDQNPAQNSNPFSFGLLYSKRSSSKDTLIFVSSSDGIFFNQRRKITTSARYLNKVALSYGYCPAFNSGRYFASWEEKDNKDDPTGRIFTSHTEPYFNSIFTTPVRLDNIEPANENLASNPVIACQNSSYNNDSANLTEIVMFETYNPSQNQHTISGVYNERAAASNSFQPFDFVVPENNILQPDICFNPFDSTFIVTYFDSTAQKLPYYTHNINMNNPDSWNCINPGYNDLNNLLSPHPQAAMDFGTHTGINAWIGTRPNGNGEALFDAPFIYYTGEKKTSNHFYELKALIYPNPAGEYTTLEIELLLMGDVEIQIFNTEGQEIEKISLPNCNVGNQQFKLNLLGYRCGVYLLKIRCGSSITNKKLIVIDSF